MTKKNKNNNKSKNDVPSRQDTWDDSKITQRDVDKITEALQRKRLEDSWEGI